MVEDFDPLRSKMAQIMDAIANKKYKIPTGNENLRRWGIVSHAIGEVDDEIDGASDDDARRVVVSGAADFPRGEAEQLEGTNTRYIDRMSRLRDLLSGFSEPERNRFIEHFQEFVDVTIKMRSESSFWRMAALRGKEGDLTANFFHDVVTPDVRNHPNLDTM